MSIGKCPNCGYNRTDKRHGKGCAEKNRAKLAHLPRETAPASPIVADKRDEYYESFKRGWR